MEFVLGIFLLIRFLLKFVMDLIGLMFLMVVDDVW